MGIAVKNVTAAMIQRDGRFLIARRARGQKLEGFWEFAGGKIEPGETPEECLRRELKEELGIDATIGGFFAESIYDYGNGKIRLLGYWVVSFEGDLVPTVHDMVEWVTPIQMRDFSMLPADVPFVHKLNGLDHV